MSGKRRKYTPEVMSPAAGAITGQSLRVDGGAAINTVGLHR